MFPRRSLIQGAAAALFVPKAPYVIGKLKYDIAFPHRSAASRPDFPAQPVAAAAAGYNTLTFWEDFNSAATVDIGFTQAPGFNIYPQPLGVFPYNVATSNEVTPPCNVSLANSLMTISGTVTHNVVEASTITTDGSGNVRGTLFAGGFYVEASMSFNPADFVHYVGGTFSYPAFWSQELAGAMTRPVGQYIEFDFYEAIPSGGTAYNSYCAMGSWIGATDNRISGHDNAGIVNGDLNLHQYGTLWIPQAKNGGVNGIVKRYFDRIDLGLDVTYSSSGLASPAPDIGSNFTGYFSRIDTLTTGNGICLHLEAGYQIPTSWDYVMVWQ